MALRQRSFTEGLGGNGHYIRLDESTGSFDAEVWCSLYVLGSVSARAEFDVGFVTSIPAGYRQAAVQVTIRPEHYDRYATSFVAGVAETRTQYFFAAGDAFGSAYRGWDDYNRSASRFNTYSIAFIGSGSERVTGAVTLPLNVSVRPEGQMLALMLTGEFIAEAGGLGGATSRLRINGQVESVTIDLTP
jgi:hypothetical protein